MLPIVSDILLTPNGFNTQDVNRLLQRSMGGAIDAADIYFQHVQDESWVLEDGLIKNTSFGINEGVGVRAISGTKTGYAYSEGINLPALEKAASAARSIADAGQDGVIPIQSKILPISSILYSQANPLLDLNSDEKVAFLHRLYEEALKQDRRVTHVSISLNGCYELILVADSENGLQADIRPLVRLSVNVVVTDNERSESASAGGGGRFGYKIFLENDRGLRYVREAVRVALVNLHAIPAPAGIMPVVLGPGWPGILLHEAIGHGLEGDFNRKGSSVFAGKIGQRVASPLCTIVDKGDIPNGQRGSLHVDDEGTPTQETVLIENGILCGYMQDKLNARLMGGKSTGNGRRESYGSVPIPRMTSTYMLAGSHSPEDIIASVEKGIYAVNFSGGQVDITSGNFVFTTSEAYLIEHGKITRPIKNAALIGSGQEVLTKVSMVGNDLAFDPGVGTCGKDGQSVAVNVGQPTIKVDELTVGGTD